MESFYIYCKFSRTSISHFYFLLLSHSCKWSHLALLKPDRDILSSCWLTITRVPSHPHPALHILLKYAAQSISLAEVAFLLYLDAITVLWDFRGLLFCSKCSFALLIFCAESLKTAVERDGIPRLKFVFFFSPRESLYTAKKKMWVKNTLAGQTEHCVYRN